MPLVGFEPTISAGERPQAAHLLRSWVRIPPGAWIFVCCECRVLSGRGLCDGLIIRPEESYRLCCVVVCDLETSRMGAPYIYIYIYDISSLRVNNPFTTTERADHLHHDNAPAHSTAIVQAFLAKRHITQVCQPPLQLRFGSLRLLAFPKTKIALESEEICECYRHTVHKLSQRRLTAD